MPSWILFSLLAMASEVGKVLVVKHLCKGVNSRVLVFVSRVVSAALLMPVLFYRGIGFPTDTTFWGVIVATSFITAVASIWITDAVKFGHLTTVMPMQAAVPVFSLLTLWVGWHETPEKPSSVIFMLLSMAAVAITLYAVNRDKASAGKSLYTVFSLAAAVLFGISTILDRVAIARLAQGALAYTACWNLFSSFVMAFETTRTRNWSGVQWKASVPAMGLLSLFSLGAFLSQQFAVQLSQTIPGGVVNVKSLVMLHLPVIVLLGLLLFRERPRPLALAASLSAILFAFLLVRSLI